MAALLTSDQGGVDRIAIEVEECHKMGIKVLPPDVNESLENFTVVEDKKIRFGLLAIKNIGAGVVEQIINERKENGIYQSLEDFLNRVRTKDINKKSLESLIKSGAVDSFGERAKLLTNLDVLLEFNKKIQKDHQNGQITLFGILPIGIKPSNGLRLKDYPPASLEQKLLWERELLGLFISAHPMKNLKSKIDPWVKPVSKLSKTSGYVIAAGIITNIKKIITSNKELMLFVKLEDESGSIEAIVFPSILKSKPEFWQENKIILLGGRATDKDGLPKIIVGQAEELIPDKIEDIINRLQGNNLPNYY
jgi:DNA polymerase-3 subunit alpha